ncbi:MAG: hypothetical protein JNJ89_14430 [Rubrivivax sp.]|nr:hypothetical protein [Rubrivivax sp.]
MADCGPSPRAEPHATAAAALARPAKATRREWTGLAVIALPCAVYAMDLTVLNLAMPAIESLERARPEAVRIGGSRAQRDLVEETLVAAYLHAARPEEARRLVAQRVHRRPAVAVAGFAPS